MSTTTTAALHLGGVGPHVRQRRAIEGPAAKLVDVGVERCGDDAGLVLREPRDTHLLGDVCHPSRADAGGI